MAVKAGSAAGRSPLDEGRARTAFRRALLTWYRATARDLPWRRTRDPYAIWLSESMLQQTRVETVVAYYERFLAAFPTVAALARAPLERVLKLWEGLGYYTRARALHRAARVIVAERGGVLPTTSTEWEVLPGVGRYTAAAIASIAHGEAVATVDGNIKRVLARLCCVKESIDERDVQEMIWRRADELLARRSAGEWNQALMELGARVCRPKSPLCEECPVRRWCGAHVAGIAESLPRRGAKRDAKELSAEAAVIWRRGRLLLVQRPAGGLLGGFWTLPGCERVDEADEQSLADRVRALAGLDVQVGEVLDTVKHVFTHRRWHVEIKACVRVRGRLRTNGTAAAWVDPTELETYPLAAVDWKLVRCARK